jgi:acetyltransferase-like isoleucine patch superfamily enzyme
MAKRARVGKSASGVRVSPEIHSTALIERDVEIGPDTSIWDNVHIRRGARIGAECIIGEKTHIAGDVSIGNRVKINAFVYICAGVTVEDGVMISAGTVFTNDRFPRATTTDVKRLRSSQVDEHTRPTLVRRGATIGAGCVVGSGIEIGCFAMVGMGSVVIKPVPDFHLALGHPARSAGCVCRCGEVFLRFKDVTSADALMAVCRACGLAYSVRAGQVAELDPPRE